MATCEMCGAQGNLIKIRVSGSEMMVCNNCKKMGSIIEKQPSKTHTFRHKPKSEIYKEVVSNHISIIQKELAKKNMDLHHLARGSNIKESSLQKYMTNKLKLDIDTAEKIGKFLQIELVEEISSTPIDTENIMSQENTSSMSLGDLIKKQMEKR